MRIRASFFAVALFLGATQARGAVAPQESTEAAAPTPATKLQELLERYDAERSQIFTAYKAAETEEEQATLIASLPGEDWAPDFRAIAEEAAGTDTAVKAWIWVLRLTESDRAKAWEVVEHLLSSCMESVALDELSGELRYASHTHGETKVIEALTAMVAESPHEKVRARALFTLGAVRFDSSAPTIQAESRACFEALIAEYGSLPYRGSSTFKTASEGFLYEMDHLQLGMVAPDFEAVDENGVAWKLSDYRGKVVVVDFWGFW